MLGCPRAQLMTTANDAIQPVLRLPIVFEGLFFRAERPRVRVAAAIDDASPMFDVQHLVKDDVLDKPFGNLARVKSLTDRDRVMRRTVMPKNASGFSPRPGEHRPGYLASEVPAVKARKNFLQIINAALRGRNNLASTLPARQVSSPQNLRSERVRTIDAVVSNRYFARQQPSHQQKRQGPNHLWRRCLKKVRQAHKDAARARADRMMQNCVGIQLPFDIRDLNLEASLPSIKLAESVVEDSLKMKDRLRHGRARFACHLRGHRKASQLPRSVDDLSP